MNELLNSLTQFIQKRQRENGLSFVSRTTLTPHQFDNLTTTVFRVVLANPLTTKEILQNILKEQKEIAILAPSLTKQIEATTQAILGEKL
ncbi:glutamate decarboxylase [Vibrio sp. JCM 19236]|nr:glutamate decarboxylase [Vibrio sp. JCM 19236]